MNSNINDPIGIAALLQQLKSSTAWQELTASSSTSINNVETSTAPVPTQALSSSSLLPENSARNVSEGAGSTVASLLSQLSTLPEPQQYARPGDFDRGYITQGPTVHIPSPPFGTTYQSTSVESSEDRSKLSFRQALPLVSSLVDDTSFVSEINKMRCDQDNLERRLWLDREAIYSKYQEKIKVAQNKAQMIGVVISEHELNMITDAFKKELAKFDLDRVIPAWDGLVSRQQLELAQLKVPTMCVTGDREHQQRQQQVVQLLESLVGPKMPNAV